jgi:hypothetical protein
MDRTIQYRVDNDNRSAWLEKSAVEDLERIGILRWHHSEQSAFTHVNVYQKSEEFVPDKTSSWARKMREVLRPWQENNLESK